MMKGREVLRGRSVLARAGLLGLMVVASAAPAASAQDGEPLSLEEFSGWKSWTLHRPGDLEIDHDRLVSQRSIFDFTPPNGQSTTMTLDVVAGVRFQGRPAAWINWISGGGNAEDGTSTLDMLIVDEETFRILFRIQAAPGERSWAGNYNLTMHPPGQVIEASVADDGTVERVAEDADTNLFDFASMGYLFALADLEEGDSFRLMNVGGGASITPRDVGIRVMGETTIRDAAGRSHPAQEVRLIANSENAVVSFIVAPEPPFFYGWVYRLVEDGRAFSQMTFRGNTVLANPAR